MSKGIVRKSNIRFKDENGEEWFVGKEIQGIDNYHNLLFEVVSIFEGNYTTIVTLYNKRIKKYQYVDLKK